MGRVLGLDPGTRVVGYAIVDQRPRGAFAFRECGAIMADPKAAVPDRLVELARELREVIREFKPTAAAVEDVFHQKNAKSALVLGQARGVALLVAAEHGLSITSYPPATVKRSICGNGRASKEQVQRMVTTLAGLSHPPSTDAADALALAICHCLRAREPRPSKGASP